ncbi:MAG TPA: SgcJ/EcaC family oxidoreductase [Gemmatimonadota bacterium]|jgi:uncharacterized protein (TIGR02246 family)
MPKHAKPLVAAAIALVLAAGCQQEPATETGTTEETPAVDVAAVQQAIEDGGDAWEAAALAGDAAALTALYTDDAIIMPPNAAQAEGSAAIQAAFTEMLAATPFTAIEIVTDGVEVSASGDMAWAHGSYTSTNTVAGEPYEDTGKWANVSENRDGKWLLVIDIWNSDTPLPGM